MNSKYFILSSHLLASLKKKKHKKTQNQMTKFVDSIMKTF